jgi:hypothetical protein
MVQKVFQYSITRPLELGPWALGFWCFIGVIFVGVITVFNTAAVGYELVPLTSTKFENAVSFWYEKLIPRESWKPQNWICEGSIIQLNTDGF